MFLLNDEKLDRAMREKVKKLKSELVEAGETEARLKGSHDREFELGRDTEWPPKLQAIYDESYYFEDEL